MISTVPELQQTPKSTHRGPALEAQTGVAKYLEREEVFYLWPILHIPYLRIYITDQMFAR